MLPQNNLFTFYAPFCQVLASARGVLSIEQHLRVFSLLPKYAPAILLDVVNTQVVVKFAIVFVCLDFKECSDVFPKLDISLFDTFRPKHREPNFPGVPAIYLNDEVLCFPNFASSSTDTFSNWVEINYSSMLLHNF